VEQPEKADIPRGGNSMAISENSGKSTIMPALRYRDAKAAIDWLCTIFGFERHAVYEGKDGTIGHAELTLGGGMIMLGSARDDEQGNRFKLPAELGGVETRSAYIVVADADAVFARAVAAGAAVVRPLQNMEYGSREFTVKDPEGHSWSAGTYDPWKAHE
jgi:uncharacterized glyoxalase superfamily protein PhnB